MQRFGVLILLASVVSYALLSTATKLDPDVQQTGSMCMLQLNSKKGSVLHKATEQHEGLAPAPTPEKSTEKVPWGNTILHFASSAASSVSTGFARAARWPVAAASFFVAKIPWLQNAAAQSHSQEPLNGVSLVDRAYSKQGSDASQDPIDIRPGTEWSWSRLFIILFALVVACFLVAVLLLVTMEVSRMCLPAESMAVNHGPGVSSSASPGPVQRVLSGSSVSRVLSGIVGGSSAAAPVTREIGTSPSFNWQGLPPNPSSAPPSSPYNQPPPSSPYVQWDRRPFERDQQPPQGFLGLPRCC